MNIVERSVTLQPTVTTTRLGNLVGDAEITDPPRLTVAAQTKNNSYVSSQL